jgi:hypothetical protein
MKRSLLGGPPEQLDLAGRIVVCEGGAFGLDRAAMGVPRMYGVQASHSS